MFDRDTAAVPLLAGERALGALVLAFDEERGFTDDDRAFALVGRQIALALERARLSDAEHQLAVSLQTSLLPQTLPDLPGVSLAARYLPSLRRVNLGGDWYDALALPEGRLGIAVGDVVGHGPRAAAVMGQLRSALRAIAVEHDEPAQVVEALSRFAETIPEALGTTLVYGVLDRDGIAPLRMRGTSAGTPHRRGRRAGLPRGRAVAPTRRRSRPVHGRTDARARRSARAALLRRRDRATRRGARSRPGAAPRSRCGRARHARRRHARPCSRGSSRGASRKTTSPCSRSSSCARRCPACSSAVRRGRSG